MLYYIAILLRDDLIIIVIVRVNFFDFYLKKDVKIGLIR